MTADFSSETTEARKWWNDIFLVNDEKKTVNAEFYIQQQCPLKLKAK